MLLQRRLPPPATPLWSGQMRLVCRQLRFTVSKQLIAECVSLSLCRGIFDVRALLGLSEKTDNMAGCRYLSWSVSRTFFQEEGVAMVTIKQHLLTQDKCKAQPDVAASRTLGQFVVVPGPRSSFELNMSSAGSSRKRLQGISSTFHEPKSSESGPISFKHLMWADVPRG